MPVVQALSGPNFRSVIRELRQTGAAVSLIGTKKTKLNKLVGKVQPMLDAMVGTRPETKRVRNNLTRRIHNLRKASTAAIPASKAIMGALMGVQEIQKLVDQRGLADVPATFEAAEFTLENVWGYSEREVLATTLVLKRASRLMTDVGLATISGTIILDPALSRGTYIGYSPSDGVFLADIDRALSGDIVEFLGARGARAWFEKLKAEDQETWGRDPERFAIAFARKLATGTVDPDTSARLAVSVGGHARRWPED